jgi:hypothetical protein
MNESYKPNGIAYVEFPTNEMFNEALKRNKERMGKRYVELFRSTKEEMNQFQFSLPNFSPYILKLENVPIEHDEVYLANLFSEFNILPQGIHLGKVEFFLIQVFNHLNEFVGEAYIEFLSLNDIKNALLKEVEKDIKITESSGFEFLVACGLIESVPKNFGKFTPNSTKSLKIEGISLETSKDEILNYFKEFDVQSEGIEYLNENVVVIQFISDQEALKAFIEKNEGKIGNNSISLSFY